MFEGIVQKLLLEYLGRYVKDIQKEQLKIGLWNGEVLLENVELILEAFDYLQLPFALKQGQVGRLSIKIPWKKLGWDPIIIFLEDVFICASQREDHEWSLDSVEKREYAGKKAKLAAAELAKLSRRVCDNQAGQSFISYITAKILDGIQVSIKNVHVNCINGDVDSEQFVFGLRFSSLTMKQNSIWSSSGKSRGGQVNKTVEISGLGIYCSKSEEAVHLAVIDNVGGPQSFRDANIRSDKIEYILAPFDMALSLMVNRSGKLESGVPQYSIAAELTVLALLLNEVQMQQILILLDYLSIYQLMEKYGRYRPSSGFLSKKLNGWQRMWWHYAQKSVLSDIRRKLRKTSWSYLGWRMSYRRKYVNFYKKKLDCLRREQPVDKAILVELEKIEKESDIDDILSYRTIAEHESQDILSSSTSTNMEKNGGTITLEKQQNDDGSSIKSRGWLNWLSLGMLGAGGTEDSIQFSGVVSDEIIKDIFEVTEFHPATSVDGGAAAMYKIYSSIKFNAHRVIATLYNKTQKKEAVKVISDDVIIEGKHWEESCIFIFSVHSVEMANPYNNNVFLLTQRAFTVDNILKIQQPSIIVQVDMSLLNYDSELSVKVVLQPIEVTYDSDVLLNLWDFLHIFASFKFHKERVMLSLNQFENVKARLLSKAEYTFSHRTKIIWDVSFGAIIIQIPWRCQDSKLFIMFLELGAINFKSRIGTESSVLVGENQQDSLLANFQYSKSTEDLSAAIPILDLYDYFKVSFTDFKVNVMLPDCHQVMAILERCDTSVALASCIIPYESLLKQLKVHFTMSALDIHFSLPIYGAIMGMLQCLDIPKSESMMLEEPAADKVFNFSVTANVERVSFHANITDDVENNLVLILVLGELEMEYAFLKFVEYHICLKTLMINTSSSTSEICSHTLCSSRNISLGNSAIKHDMGDVIGISSADCCQSNVSGNGCFLLHYKTQRSGGFVSHKYRLWLNDVDLHFYPGIVGLLLNFCNKLSGYGTDSSASPAMKSCGVSKESKDANLMPNFDLQRFGFSNFCEAESDDPWRGIPLDQFPFITIRNSGSLGSLEQSLIYGIPEWRKALKVGNKNSATIPKSSEEKRSQMYGVPTTKPPYSLDKSLLFASHYDADEVILDLNLNRIKAHFHDASCVLGVVTLPVSKSSLIIHDSDYLVMLCSFEGLLLSSSWSTHYHEVLWDSSVPNLSPILNVRLRKEKRGVLIPEIEVSISIQHVCCVLPADFLAMLIGYFSLPDWSSNESEPCVVKKDNHEDAVGHYCVIYKFEVLDSLLILPLERSKHESLHLELQQLYCSFRPRNRVEDAFGDVPPDCMVPLNKVTSHLHLLNIYGRDLYLSLVLPKDDESVSVKLDQDLRHGNIPLIAPMNADLWIRIPCNSDCFHEHSPPTCVMMKIQNCQVVAEDEYFIFGVEAVLDVIDQISLVGLKSKGFTSDVLQFLQFNRSLKEGTVTQPMVSSMSLTDVRVLANSMSINLVRYMRSHIVSSQLVAKTDMQFNLCASFRDDIPLGLDIDCSHLLLHSFHSSSTLVECTSEGPSLYGLVIHLSRSDQGTYELLVDLPSAHVWLHLLDWSAVIDHLVSYSKKLSGTSSINASSANSNSFPMSVPVNMLHNDLEPLGTSSSISLEKIKENVALIMKSENISISFHFPLSAKEAAFDRCREVGQQKMASNYFLDTLGGRKIHGAKCCKYTSLILNCKDCELVISGHLAKLKCYMEKIKGMSEIVEDRRILSWTLFQLFRVHVMAETFNKQQKQHTVADVRIDSLDVQSSQQIFAFWHGIEFKIPQTGSSQISMFSMALKVQLRKASLLLTDGKWSCNAPLLEILMRNLLLLIDTTERDTEVTLTGDLVANYKNIHTVMWEPFVEPWNFELKMIRKHRQSALVNTFVTTDIHLKSTTQLNVNFTEPLIEVIYRVSELIKDVQIRVGLNDCPESQRYVDCQTSDNVRARYAPYILQNETSLPLSFQVSHGLAASDNFDILTMKEGSVVHPGSSIPIYIDETPEENAFHLRPPQSSDRLNDKTLNGVQHMISIKIDGTSGPSIPISMDVVGLNYFEVNFSKASEKIEVQKNEDSRNIEDRNGKYPSSGYVVPVVFDVSVQQYSRLIRLYSTVVLSNSTSMPLELRFDIPFGVSPKVLDPIYPGQEFPLPLHLAEAGLMRWRPLGKSYLWSEAQLLSNLLSMENKPGFLRSFVCYPSHPSSDPFRCCISIQHIHLPSSTSQEDQDHRGHGRENPKKRFIHNVTLTTPLFVRSYLPHKVSLTIESGGIARTVVLSEAGSASIFHVDSTHDLGLLFHVHGFNPCSSKFQRAETFATVSKFNETKFSLSETLAIHPDSCTGPIYVTVEKVLDALCGARELCISVPFLLYNCTGLPLIIAGSGNEIEGNSCSIPSCYHLIKLDKLHSKKHGLSLVPSEQDSHVCCSTSKNQPLTLRENAKLHRQMFLNMDFSARDSVAHSLEHKNSTNQLSEECEKEFDVMDIDSRNAKACMYSPHPSSSASELMVRLSLRLPESIIGDIKNSVWSSSFFLVPPSGSTSVIVPQTLASGAFIISATSSLLSSFSGRTRAITFQPRYVISNACSRSICYKQKGTDSVFLLGTGEHSHLHLADTTRELLMSLRFNETGWLWSGSFFPDHLGDTQVKMRNYVSGALNMIRVEIHNADVPIKDEKIVGSTIGKSGTLLILLSDDNTGFMPYRIDNFSMERLRVYQQKCEVLETIVHNYTSCPYAWDEPCYPHRLVVEVPGECILGSYALDIVKEQTSVYIPPTSEKPGRRLFLAIHAEGAIKVLSIIASSHHLLKDMKETCFPGFKEKKKLDQKEESLEDYNERLSVHITFIGISLINSIPQELLFLSANDTKIDILQNVEQQKLFFHISSLQIDNQLVNATYPVILSFDHDDGSDSVGHIKTKDDNNLKFKAHMPSERSCQPIFFLAAAKWRNKEISLVSFEYISLRLAPLRLELEEEVILCLLNFFRNVVSRLKNSKIQCPDSEFHNLAHENCSSSVLPSVVPIGAPWQQIYLLARRQKKIYVEAFDLSHIKLALSFSSAPWMLKNEGPTSTEFLGHASGTVLQRGLITLADIEGAPVRLRELIVDHHMGSWESFQEILIRHYTRQLLHETYKIFGSAGVIGNPMGFARNLGLGIKDFLSVPAKGILQSPAGLIIGMVQGTSSLFSNTVYAVSNAATQFSKSAHKSIVALTFDSQVVSRMEKQQKVLSSQSKGVLNEFLEGLTGFLQSPVRGAEKHGLPGVLTGIALGTAGLVARPVASILEVTGKTAQSIRNRSRLHHPRRFRVRFPRPLVRELPLQPYSWEEAIGASMLLEAADSKLKDEIFVKCKALKQAGSFVIITKRLIMIFSCSSLVGLGTPEFHGVADPEWVIEVEMGLESVIHVDREKEVLNIVGSRSETLLKQHQQKKGIARTKWQSKNSLPLFQMNVELKSEEEAEEVLQVILSTIENIKEPRSGVHVLHQSNLRQKRML